MQTFGRIVRSFNYNVVLYAIAAVALLFTFTSPTVSDPLLNFLFAGTVPGTDHVIAPDVMLMAATAALGLMLVSVLLFWLVRRVRNRRLMQHHQDIADNDGQIIFSRENDMPSVAKPAKAAAAHKGSKAVVVAVPKAITPKARAVRHPGSFRASFRTVRGGIAIGIFIVSRVVLRNAVRVLFSAVAGIFRSVQAGILGIGLIISLAIGFLLSMVFKLFVISIIVGGALLKFVRFASKKFWDWLEPHAEKLDTWLELQCRAFITFARKRLSRIDAFQVVAAIIRETKTSIRMLFKQL